MTFEIFTVGLLEVTTLSHPEEQQVDIQKKSDHY